MQYTTLGRTGLKVSVAGLGCGGSSRLGLPRAGKAHASNMVRAALGINLIDNARGYGTEEAVGEALIGIPRASYVLTTKHLTVVDGHILSPDEFVAGFNQSLRELRTDHVDVFFLHGLNLARWDHAIGEILPALMRE